MGLLHHLFAHPECPRRRGSAPHTTRPQVEPLEDRTVPTVLENQVFVATLYRTLLNRNADFFALSFWGGALNSGATRNQVASGILNSQEYRAREVENIYETVLGRQADLFGLRFWTGALRAGATLKQVEAGILGSDEFFARAGSNSTGFLNLVSLDVLGRPADATVLSLLPAGFASTSSRAAAALQVLTSPAVNQVLVTNFYQEILGRAPDPFGLGVWTGLLQAGVSEEGVIAGIFASDEFFVRMQAATANITDPLAAAAQFTASPTLFTISSGLSPNLRLLSPAFGNLAIVPTFDQANPGTGLGTFGVTGFIPAISALPPQTLPPTSSLIVSNGGVIPTTIVPSTTVVTTPGFVTVPGTTGTTILPGTTPMLTNITPMLTNITPMLTNITPMLTNVTPTFVNTTMPGFSTLPLGFGTGPQLALNTPMIVI
jgi:hypothetical protein